MTTRDLSEFRSGLDPALSALAGADWITWYHAGCQDGSTSAAVVRLAAEAAGVPSEAQSYFAAQYNTPSHEPRWEELEARVAAGRALVLHVVDFSWPAPILLRLASLASQSGGVFRCLDHHDSALRRLTRDLDGQPLPGLTMDLTRSGARLTWDACFPTLDPPDLVLAVEDADLWRWSRLPLSREVWDLFGATGWHLRPDHGPELRDMLRAAGPLKQSQAWSDHQAEVLKGLAQDQIRQACQLAVSRAHGLLLRGPLGEPPRLFAAACAPIHLSDVGHALCEAFPGYGAAVWRIGPNGTVLVSLRAPDPSHAVNRVAEVYQGGGHPAAASFSVDWATFSAAFLPEPPASPEVSE